MNINLTYQPVITALYTSIKKEYEDLIGTQHLSDIGNMLCSRQSPFWFHSSDHPTNLMAPGDRHDYRGRFGAGQAESRPWMRSGERAYDPVEIFAFNRVRDRDVPPQVRADFDPKVLHLRFDEFSIEVDDNQPENTRLWLRYQIPHTVEGVSEPNGTMNWLVQFIDPQTEALLHYGALPDDAGTPLASALGNYLTAAFATNGRAAVRIGHYGEMLSFQLRAQSAIEIA